MNETTKAAESANKNLDNALEYAVYRLKQIADHSCPNGCDCLADDALQKIAAILKVKQKD